MANILILSEQPLPAKQWQKLLSEQHQVSLLSDAALLQQAITVQNIALIIIDGKKLHNDADLLKLRVVGPKVLLIGFNWPEHWQINLLVSGVAGYCEYNSSLTTLAAACNSILAGDIWVQRQLVPKIISRLIQLNIAQQTVPQTGMNSMQVGLDALTHRELDVAKMIRTGENNKKIAMSLNISERTVKAHLTSIFQKLNVQDRVHLALLLQEISY